MALLTKPRKTYPTSVSNTASTAKEITLANVKMQSNRKTLSVISKGCDVLIKLGDSTVTASSTEADGAYAEGNIYIAEGVCVLIPLDTNDTHFSAVSIGTGETGTLYTTIETGGE